MTARVVDGPLRPGGLAGAAEDPGSGALVVLSEPAGDSPLDADGGAEALERTLARLEERALERFEVRRCRLRLHPSAGRGEPLAAVAVRAPHRGAAFDAARWALGEAVAQIRGAEGPARGPEPPASA